MNEGTMRRRRENRDKRWGVVCRLNLFRLVEGGEVFMPFSRQQMYPISYAVRAAMTGDYEVLSCKPW
jgi:hypothetical protein